MSAEPKTQTVGSPRSDQEVREKPGRAVDVPLCGQTRHGGVKGGKGEGVIRVGGGSVSLLTLARTFSKEAGLTREKHIKNTSWEKTKEMAG